MEINHLYHLSIPLNVDNLDNIPDGILWEDIKFEEYQISKDDYDNIFDLFCQFRHICTLFLHMSECAVFCMIIPRLNRKSQAGIHIFYHNPRKGAGRSRNLRKFLSCFFCLNIV